MSNNTQITVITQKTGGVSVVAIGRGLQGASGQVAISADPDNRLVRGLDAGLLVPDLVTDPLAYYILAKA